MSHPHANIPNPFGAQNGTTEGAWAQQAEAQLPERRLNEEIERGLAFGLTAAPSIVDRRISTFVRGELPHFAGETGTFLKCPFIEDVNQVKDAEVAIFGAPLDTGTTYRPGTRFGPQGIRRATNLFGTYSFEYGVDLREQLNVVDIGDIFTIPANLEKSFDQISRGMAHVVEQGVFPVVLGGDHSIGYPTVRGLAEQVEGPIGIIHFDRHVDTQESDLDERMHTTPWFHATNLPNAPATNLVQIGIGNWRYSDLPQLDLSKPAATYIVFSICVSKTAPEDQQAVAHDFIRYMAQQPEVWLKYTGQLTPLQSLQTSSTAREIMPFLDVAIHDPQK